MQSIWYFVALVFFFPPVLAPFAGVLVFFVTLVDVFASDDVDFALGVVALGLAGAGAGFGTGAGVGVAAGFFAASTF